MDRALKKGPARPFSGSDMEKTFSIIEEKSGPACLALLMLVLALQVAGRALGFGSSLVWTDEAARALFVWSIFLSLPLASKKGAMVSIKLSEKLWPGPLKIYLPKAAALLWALACLALACLSLINIYAHRAFPQLTPILGLNHNHLFLVIPFSFSLVFIRTVLDFFKGDREI